MLNEVNECGTTKYLEGIGRSDPTLIIIILLNAVVILTLRMKKMQLLPEKEDDEEEEDHTPKSSSYVTGSLEENESDFHDPEEDELEIIDLDNASDDDED